MKTPVAEAAVRPEFLSYEEARRYCGISRQQLWREIKAGNVQAYKAGRRVLISRESLDAFVRRVPAAE